MTEVVIAYLHFIALIALGTALAAELLYLDDASEDSAQLHRLGWIDVAYIGSAILALATGVMWLIWSGKGAVFYLHNPVFYIKVALFLALGLVSVSPARYMLRWRREAADSILPPPEEVAHVRRYVIAELALFLLIPLFAVLAARGIGTQ